MKLELTTWQRVNCLNVIGSIGGADAKTFRKANKLLDILEMTDDEKEQVGYADNTTELKCDLSGLQSRFGIDVEGAWINVDVGEIAQQMEEIFIKATLSGGVSFEGNLLSLQSHADIEIESVWINVVDGVQTQRPGDVFIAARISTGQATWSDQNQEHRWEIEIKDGNLATMLKEQVATFKWQQGILAARKMRTQVIDLLDRLGIDEE